MKCSALPTTSRRLYSTRRQGSPTNGSPAPAGNGPPPPMTESQRRYLFRILAGWGFSGDSATEYLRDKLGIASVTGLTKFEATKLIDRLLLNAPQGVSTRGDHQP